MSKDYSRGPSFIRRMKHRKGHGVHSPFAYALINEVFNRKECDEQGSIIFDALRAIRLSRRDAIRLSNLYVFCRFDVFVIDTVSMHENVDNLKTIFIAPAERTVAEILSLVELAAEADCVCVAMPRKGKDRRALCRWLVENHRGMSISTRGMLLLFYDTGLNQQHIIL